MYDMSSDYICTYVYDLHESVLYMKNNARGAIDYSKCIICISMCMCAYMGGQDCIME